MDLPELATAKADAQIVAADVTQVIQAAKVQESKLVTLDSYKAALIGFMVASFVLGLYVGHLIGARV
jgi:hypothetical protein